MSVEIFNGSYAASLWADAHADALGLAAVTAGALDFEMKRTAWGVVFEVEFKDEAAWEAYKASEAVRNALNTAPDPANGVLIYRGRSLDTGHNSPRKPKPIIGSGAASLSVPFELPFVSALPAFFSGDDAITIDRRTLTQPRI